MAEDVYSNSTAERLNGIIKNEYLVHRAISNQSQLSKETDRSVKLHNQYRTHSSLKNQIPIEFEQNFVLFAKQQNLKMKKLIDGNSARRGHRVP